MVLFNLLQYDVDKGKLEWDKSLIMLFYLTDKELV